VPTKGELLDDLGDVFYATTLYQICAVTVSATLTHVFDGSLMRVLSAVLMGIVPGGFYVLGTLEVLTLDAFSPWQRLGLGLASLVVGLGLVIGGFVCCGWTLDALAWHWPRGAFNR
jgi:hypothetical protein